MTQRGRSPRRLTTSPGDAGELEVEDVSRIRAARLDGASRDVGAERARIDPRLLKDGGLAGGDRFAVQYMPGDPGWSIDAQAFGESAEIVDEEDQVGAAGGERKALGLVEGGGVRAGAEDELAFAADEQLESVGGVGDED